MVPLLDELQKPLAAEAANGRSGSGAAQPGLPDSSQLSGVKQKKTAEKLTFVSDGLLSGA